MLSEGRCQQRPTADSFGVAWFTQATIAAAPHSPLQQPRATLVQALAVLLLLAAVAAPAAAQGPAVWSAFAAAFNQVGAVFGRLVSWLQSSTCFVRRSTGWVLRICVRQGARPASASCMRLAPCLAAVKRSRACLSMHTALLLNPSGPPPSPPHTHPPHSHLTPTPTHRPAKHRTSSSTPTSSHTVPRCCRAAWALPISWVSPPAVGLVGSLAGSGYSRQPGSASNCMAAVC